MSELVLYGRPGCHLCDEARDLLTPLAREARIPLREIDIESDDRLHRAYLERIPVIELDGEVISELVPHLQVLRSIVLHTGP